MSVLKDQFDKEILHLKSYGIKCDDYDMMLWHFFVKGYQFCWDENFGGFKNESRGTRDTLETTPDAENKNPKHRTGDTVTKSHK
jgi:hypothetical protein